MLPRTTAHVGGKDTNSTVCTRACDVRLIFKRIHTFIVRRRKIKRVATSTEKGPVKV